MYLNMLQVCYNAYNSFRGFAFLYQKDGSYEGFKLQLQAMNMDYVIEMKSIPTNWFFVTFTWHAEADGMIFFCCIYNNRKLILL